MLDICFMTNGDYTSFRYISGIVLIAPEVTNGRVAGVRFTCTEARCDTWIYIGSEERSLKVVSAILEAYKQALIEPNRPVGYPLSVVVEREWEVFNNTNMFDSHHLSTLEVDRA
jgi:hypothetical protein